MKRIVSYLEWIRYVPRAGWGSEWPYRLGRPRRSTVTNRTRETDSNGPTEDSGHLAAMETDRGRIPNRSLLARDSVKGTYAGSVVTAVACVIRERDAHAVKDECQQGIVQITRFKAVLT